MESVSTTIQGGCSPSSNPEPPVVFNFFINTTIYL